MKLPASAETRLGDLLPSDHGTDAYKCFQQFILSNCMAWSCHVQENPAKMATPWPGNVWHCYRQCVVCTHWGSVSENGEILQCGFVSVQPKSDYRKFLRLCSLLLDGANRTKIFFFTPGAFPSFVVPLILHLAFYTELLWSDILGVNGKQKEEGFRQKDL